VAFGLAPLADEAQRDGDARRAGVIRDAVARLRQGVRDLRTLLVEIHPPRLESAGLEPALSDLLSPLEAAGIATALRVEGNGGAHASDPLIYRAAREAIRNAQEHAAPSSVEVTVMRPAPGTTRLTVHDDGRGFDTAARSADGHVGLTLLGDLARQSGGRLDVRSGPGEGTTVVLEVPE
jgi:signal transduction histidine kinase